jgi:peptidoglycan hydrolase-like protein with peptidoglycan-binding domain
MALAIAVTGAGAAVGQQATGGSSGLLVEGSQGSEVGAVQKALGIPATGVLDPKTEAAVKGFQQRNGLAGLAPAPAETSAPAAQAGSAGSPALEAIAQCESGGNPQAVGGGGQFRGKYQFTQETWAAVGGSGDPAAAPEAEQDRRAAMLYAQSGPSQWPACGR